MLRGKSIIDAVRADLETLERFDMSQSDDRTEDFAGGGRNRTKIRDPGEFLALRANA